MAETWGYDEAVGIVSNWFNTSADNVWNVVNEYNLTPAQVLEILPTTDKFDYHSGYDSGYLGLKYADGSVASWNNVAGLQTGSANPIESALNSNAGTTSQQTFQLPATTDYSGTGGAFKAKKGLLNTPVNQPNIMSQVSTGVAAAGLGITLGKVVDAGLYHALPYFFDNLDVTYLNPETWNSITVDMSDTGWEGTLKRAFNAIFGLDPNTGKSQMYLDENAAAYLAMYLQEMGVFNSGDYTASVDNETFNTLPTQSVPQSFPVSQGLNLTIAQNADGTGNRQQYTLELNSGSATVFACACGIDGTGAAYRLQIYAASTSPFSGSWTQSFPDGGSPITIPVNANSSYWVAGKTLYYALLANYSTSQRIRSYIGLPQPTQYFTNASSGLNSSQAQSMAYIAVYGNISGGGGVEGITDQDGATKPDFTGCETPADYKQALQAQYPDLFQNAITQDVAQPDGSVVRRTYIPVGTPTATGTQDTQPVTNPDNTGQSQDQTEVDPQAATQTIIKTILKYIENTRTPDTPDTPNPPDTGDGNTPPVVPPTGSASALWSVYNPTQAQLNSFGAWLWSSSFIDQVLKLFNNPMQSIIGVHKIFATPAISGSGNIVVGYLDSGVGSNLVGAQYTTVNCGSVSVREQFGNVFDYTDTQVRLYLPFIGIVDLDTSDVMRGTVSVVYHVDVITGACLAEVRVTRDGSGGTLYQFAGDASVRYPISSGSYMGIVSGIASAVGGIASAIMTGGATLPMAAGAVAGGLSGAKTNVQHSGSFSGNAGAMGAKKPYLIIERPQTLIADGFGNYQGKAANVVRTVSQCSGYFKMSDVHTDSISGASAAEIQAIKTALESGVIK